VSDIRLFNGWLGAKECPEYVVCSFSATSAASAYDLDPVEYYTKVLDIGHHMNWILAPLRRITHDTAVVKTYRVLRDRQNICSTVGKEQSIMECLRCRTS
jgi:hypothetical protein